MSALPMVLMIAGTAMSAIGTYQQSQTQAATAKYNAQVAAQQAEAVRRAGEFEAAKIAREKKQMLGRQKARYGKAGVLSFTGSPLEVMADTAAQYELDIAASRYNTQVGVSRYKYESTYQKGMAGRYATAGYIGAGSTLLTGAGEMIGYGAKK